MRRAGPRQSRLQRTDNIRYGPPPQATDTAADSATCRAATRSDHTAAWTAAIQTAHASLVSHGVWELIPLPTSGIQAWWCMCLTTVAVRPKEGCWRVWEPSLRIRGRILVDSLLCSADSLLCSAQGGLEAAPAAYKADRESGPCKAFT